jgi:hypothetical protein
MWKCSECNNWKKCHQKQNEDFVIDCISNGLKHFVELNIPDVRIAKRKVGCRYTPTCTIRGQNQACKPTRKCYVKPT